MDLLERAGYSVNWRNSGLRRSAVDEISFLDEAIRTSRRTIVLASQAYFQSAIQQFEWAEAWRRDPAGRSGSLIVVRVEDCGLEPLLLLAPCIDLFHRGEADARSIFVQEIREIVAGTRRQSESSPVAVANTGTYDLGARRQFLIVCDDEDDQWSSWVAWSLQDAGYSVFFESFDFLPGQMRVVWISDALRLSDRAIVVAAPSFMRSAICEAQWRVRAAMNPNGVQESVLVTRAEECLLPEELLSAPRVDLFGQSEVECRAHLLEFVRSLGLEPDVGPTDA